MKIERDAVKLLAITLCMIVPGALLTGCGIGASPSKGGETTVLSLPPMQGSVHGGQQPIVGAAIHLYAAGTSGYGLTTNDLLTNPVSSDGTGSYSITNDYHCTAGQQMYLVAIGGDPGTGINPNIALMAGLGDCSALKSSTYTSVNEVTTIATVFALAPFMTAYNAVGTNPSNVAGLAQAFNSINKLVNTTNGGPGGPALPAGATAPVVEINTLADVLASCINSKGGTSGDHSSCGNLFFDATPAGNTPPTDTIGAALLIAQHPALQTVALFGLINSQAPFQPQFGTAPADWTMSIVYSNAGLSAPKSTTIDANGNVWVANSGNNTVTALTAGGAPLSGSPFSGNGLAAPAAIAIDATGNAWIANKGAASLSVFTGVGATYGASPFTPANLSAPAALAFDAVGNLWVANSGNSSVTEVSSSGTALQSVSNGISSPTSIAIDPR